MKKKLTTNLTLYFKNFYPFSTHPKKTYNYEITIAIGGNIGNTFKIFHKLFLHLQNNSKYHLVKTAPILKNPPFGYLEQNYFFNSVIVLQTNVAPFQVLKEMQKYENKFKRKRTFQDAPRTLDIDIIFIKKLKKQIISKDPILTLPHSGWNKRESVLIPLTYLQ